MRYGQGYFLNSVSRFAIGGGGVPPFVPETDPNILTVAAGGGYVTYDTPGDVTFAPGVSPLYLVLDRPGFDATGAAVTHADQALILTQHRRQPYPNQTLKSADQVSLSRTVYSTDIIVGGSAVNNSTIVSPDPICAWTIPMERPVVGNAFTPEMQAAHINAMNGEEIACAELRITGNVSGTPTTITQIVSASAVSTLGPRDCGALVTHSAALDLSGFDDNQSLTVNGKGKPWIGGAASVADSADSAVAREFSPRTIYRSTTLASAPRLAYVDATTGNDTTGVISTNPTLASATPFATASGAIIKDKTNNGANDGLRVRYKAGTHTGFGATIAAGASAQSFAEVVIEGDPLVNDPTTIIVNFNGWRPRLSWIRMKGFQFNRSGTTQMTAEAGGMSLTFEDMDFDNQSRASALFSTAAGSAYWNGVRISNCTTQLLSAGSSEARLIRGVEVVSGTSSLDKWLICASKATGAAMTIGSRTESGSMIASTQIYGMTTNSLAGGATANVTGMAILSSVLEYTSATKATSLRLSGDDDAGDMTHVILRHCTLPGFEEYGRANLFYDETDGNPRTHKLISMVGCDVAQLNTKSDVFHLDGTRQGNWDFMFGVDCAGNVARYVDAGGGDSYFNQAYPGVRSLIAQVGQPIDPMYVDPKCTTAGPVAGAGGGNYRIADESPLASRVSPEWRGTRFDLDGRERGTFTAAGAYIPLQGDVEVPIDTGGGDTGSYVPAGADGGTGAVWDGTTSPLSLTIEGVTLDMGNVSSSGQHVDGTWWVVPDHADGIWLEQPYIDAAETADLFMGGCMLDPGRPTRPDIQKQGFDWRTVGNKTNPALPISGSGPGNTYDPSYALAFPRRIDTYADGPTTIWIYRGVDNDQLVSGGGASGCARLIQVTVYASAPGTNPIKPPGVYVSGGKPTKVRADLNFAALPSLTLPGGAVQPVWTADFGLHKHPLVRWGSRNESAAYIPQRYQEAYAANQSVMTNAVAIGCCYNIATRQELIERMVRDGMEIQAGTAYAPDNSTFFSGGGFGPGGKLPRFIAHLVLGDAAYDTQPGQVWNSAAEEVLLEYFAEDCSTFWSVLKTGDAPDAGGTYEALYGTREYSEANDDGDYAKSHTSRDIDGLRDSYRIAQFTWEVESVSGNTFTVTAASHDATKIHQPSNGFNQGYHVGMKIMDGANAGEWLFMSQKVSGVDVSWNAATRTVTVEAAASWSLPVNMPGIGDTVEFRPAAVYSQIVLSAFTGTCLAVVAMNKVTEFCNTEQQRALFMRALKHITDNGKLTDKSTLSPPFQRSSSATTCTWGQEEATLFASKWHVPIYTQLAASWPNFTGPL